MWAGQKALGHLQQIQQEGVHPSSVTFVGVLNACASIVALEEGRGVHDQIIQRGCESDVFVGVTWWTCMQNVGALIRMLGVCSTRCHILEIMWLLGLPSY
jgi:hypothetical protein